VTSRCFAVFNAFLCCQQVVVGERIGLAKYVAIGARGTISTKAIVASLSTPVESFSCVDFTTAFVTACPVSVPLQSRLDWMAKFAGYFKNLTCHSGLIAFSNSLNLIS